MKNLLPCSVRAGIAIAIALSAAGSAVSDALSSAQVRQLAESEVIVILRDQLTGVPAARRAMGARAAAVTAAQSPLLAQLQGNRARKVTQFATINAFAAKVSAAEAAQLASHPLVQAVVPDRVIHQRRREQTIKTAGGAAAPGSSELCGTLEPEALQLTHTAFSNASTPQAQAVLDGNGKPVTGLGVKVAFIADGLDPNVAGFIRPDGSHVFIDYQDFSGDPAGTATPGGEAFGDASSIAAQDLPRGKPLTFDIAKFVNPAHPLPSPCAIRIRGMAPGASLVGLKVFSSLGTTTASAFVQAIDYAVVHDDVDVLNESFGGTPYPDTSNDPISLANAAAVRAGTTVTVSTGDAGPAGTLGTPSTDPYVISVGGSTQFRLYAQTGYGAQALAHGYVSNNISALSSGGFAQSTARTVDVVAPGDLGWALCSTNTALYSDCVDFKGGATPIQDFGGTSESAPLTAGEAALVIQAYRSSHAGADPAPALVKKIIMSTAMDLGAPSSEQGAGLINALEAVRMALSIGKPRDALGAKVGGAESAEDEHDGGGGQARSTGLFIDSAGVSIIAAPNTRESRIFKVTNTGSTRRRLAATLQTLGAPIAGATLNVQLTPSSDPTFINPTGAARPYVKQKFTVPAGAEHLDAAIAFQVSLYTSDTPIAYIALLDPAGRQAAYSIPQGLASGYGHVDVVNPAAGTWTAVIWTRPPGTGSYSGPVQFTWAAERFVNLGAVYPAKFELEPGATQVITADFFMPREPGDLAAGIRFKEAGRDEDTGLPEVPVTLRALIPLGPTGGSFTGTLTGGNGRPGAGPAQTFEFEVPRGAKNLSLALEIADNGYLLEGVLVDPKGMPLSVEPNVDPFGNPQYGLQLFHYEPQPGRWKFILVQDFTSSGNQTSLPFTARIGFNALQITASGLPNSPSAMISASGAPLTVDINVTNTGAITEAVFADARLNTLGVATLPPQQACASPFVPGTCALFHVPTQVSTLLFTAQASVPITMDAYNSVGYNVGGTGSPHLFAKQAGTDTVTALLSESEIPYGAWLEWPALIGPFGPSGASAEYVAMSAHALLQPFDAAVAASSGDIWADLTLGTSTYNPLVLASGQGGTITLTIKPDASQVGRTIKGYLYVDTFNGVVGTGDELARIPYGYTVAP